jgi:hypothetical protein
LDRVQAFAVAVVYRGQQNNPGHFDSFAMYAQVVMSKKAPRKPKLASDLTKQRDNEKTQQRRLLIATTCAVLLAVIFAVTWGMEQWRIRHLETFPVELNGGWIPDIDNKFDQRTCDIERLDSLSTDDFIENYRLRAPFILTNVTDDWNQAAFSKGEWIQVNKANEIIRLLTLCLSLSHFLHLDPIYQDSCGTSMAHIRF